MILHKVRNSFFSTIEKILQGESAKRITEDTKAKVQKVITNGEIKTQTNKINEALQERQAELEAQLPPKVIRQEKEAVRQRVYKATSQLKKDDEHSLEK